MATTLKAQIDNLVGSGIASTAYDDWLRAGARTIVDILKFEDLERHSSSITIPQDSGLSVQLYRIWRILCNGNAAINRSTGNGSQVLDSNSFYKATQLTPAYIIKAGTLRCYDGRSVAVDNTNALVSLNGAGTGYVAHDVVTVTGGMQLKITGVNGITGAVVSFTVQNYGTSVTAGTAKATVGSDTGVGFTVNVYIAPVSYLIGIQYPTTIDSSSDTDISGVPENMHHAVILYAAIQAVMSQISSLSADMNTKITASLTDISSISIPTLDLSTQFSSLATSLDTDQDIELAMAKIKEIDQRVSDWVQYNYKHDFEGPIAKLKMELEKMGTIIQSYGQKLTTYQLNVQQLQAEYHGVINLYLGRETRVEGDK